jgi:hypothetical protein
MRATFFGVGGAQKKSRQKMTAFSKELFFLLVS